jgi:hypothetical protein
MPPQTEKNLHTLTGFTVKREYVEIKSADMTTGSALVHFIPTDDVIDFALATVGTTSTMSILVPGCEFSVKGTDDAATPQKSPKALFESCVKHWISAQRD